MEFSDNKFSLKNETAVISGGGSGIGFAIAKAMHDSGATTILLGRNKENLEIAVSELGEGAHFRIFDVRDYAGSKLLFSELKANFGPTTILVNNAGNHLKKDAVETSYDEFESVLGTHILGAHNLTTEAGKQMLSTGKGHILFIASMASLLGIPKIVAYSAAKAAYLGMVRSLAMEWSSNGIRVNAIAPGWINTAMTKRAFENDNDRYDKIISRSAIPHLGEPEDIAWTAVFLSSVAAKFITGAVIPVDGGASIGF